MLELSTTEQKLVEDAREEFGDFLTSFLLTGLGEDAGRGRHFAITYAGGGGILLERQVQVITYEPAGGEAYLPKRRDPLVLLALLKLLTGRQASRYDLYYKHGEVLNLLGWDDGAETRNEIDGAVDRYSLMAFKWERNGTELVKDDLSRYVATGCLISEYGIVDEGEGYNQRVRNRVVFDSDFIERLRHRSLFEIDWNEVRSLRPDNG